MRTYQAICVSALLIASGAQAQKPSPMTAAARKIIEQRLTDPASLQVRNTRPTTVTTDGKPISILCGEYNSKNRLGGYVGFKRFIYDPAVAGGVLTVDEDGSIAFFSSAGTGDMIDPVAMVRAGASGDAVSASLIKYTDVVSRYLPACLLLLPLK